MSNPTGDALAAWMLRDELFAREAERGLQDKLLAVVNSKNLSLVTGKKFTKKGLMGTERAGLGFD